MPWRRLGCEAGDPSSGSARSCSARLSVHANDIRCTAHNIDLLRYPRLGLHSVGLSQASCTLPGGWGAWAVNVRVRWPVAPVLRYGLPVDPRYARTRGATAPSHSELRQPPWMAPLPTYIASPFSGAAVHGWCLSHPGGLSGVSNGPRCTWFTAGSFSCVAAAAITQAIRQCQLRSDLSDTKGRRALLARRVAQRHQQCWLPSAPRHYAMPSARRPGGSRLRLPGAASTGRTDTTRPGLPGPVWTKFHPHPRGGVALSARCAAGYNAVLRMACTPLMACAFTHFTQPLQSA